MKNKKETKLLEKPDELGEDELRVLALKTILEEPSDNNNKFESMDKEEKFFRTDLYFLLHEKGFNYSNKVFLKYNLTNDKNQIQTLIQ